jgi:hypothetical protein
MTKSVLMTGFLVWLIPFGISCAIFPLKTSARPLFESIMPVVVTATTVVFLLVLDRRRRLVSVRNGVAVGLIWLVLNWGLDLALFSWGPMPMSVPDYMADIGLVYLIIPIVAVGFTAKLGR